MFAAIRTICVSALAAALLSCCAASPAVVVFGPGAPHYRACGFEIWHVGIGASGAYLIVRLNPGKQLSRVDYPVDRAEVTLADFHAVVLRRTGSYTVALANLPGSCVTSSLAIPV